MPLISAASRSLRLPSQGHHVSPRQAGLRGNCRSSPRSDALCQRASVSNQLVSRQLAILGGVCKLIADHCPARHVAPAEQLKEWSATAKRRLDHVVDFGRLFAVLTSWRVDHRGYGPVHEMLWCLRTRAQQQILVLHAEVIART